MLLLSTIIEEVTSYRGIFKVIKQYYRKCVTQSGQRLFCYHLLMSHYTVKEKTIGVYEENI